MTHVAFIIYREWAYRIFKNIKAFEKTHPFFKADTIITTPNHEFNTSLVNSDALLFETDGNNNREIYNILTDRHIDVACFYGWSWIVHNPTFSDFLCLCLHPSPLPKYRGGTPLQHQIIHGEKQSAVSVFRMSEGIDDGDIYMQRPLSLEGNISTIFKRMTTTGTEITKKFLVDYKADRVRFTPQKNPEEHSPLKRRRQEDGVFTLKQLSTYSYEYLSNCVRALSSPYPNIIIDTGRLQLSVAEIKKCSSLPSGIISVRGNTTQENIKLGKDPVFIQLKSGFAKLVSYKVM